MQTIRQAAHSVIVLLQFTATVAMLTLPSLNADIIDKGIARGDTGYVVRVGGVMLAVALVQAACSMASAWYGGRTAMAFGRDVRKQVFARIGSFSAREVSTFGAPSLITRATNDVQQVQMLAMMTCLMAVTIPIMMVGGIVMAMREDFGLSWLVVAVVPVLFACIGLVVSQMVPAFRSVQERLDDVNRILREQITGIRVVRAFVREPHEARRFARANDDLTAVSLRAGRWMALMFPLVMGVSNVASVGVIWFGGHRVDNGQMEVGALTALHASHQHRAEHHAVATRGGRQYLAPRQVEQTRRAYPQQARLLKLLPPVAGAEVHFATGGFQLCGIGGQLRQPVELFFSAVGVALAQQITHSRGN